MLSVVVSFGLAAALICFLVLAQKTNIVRDSYPLTLPDVKAQRPYSLAKCQMAFWFFIVLGTFLFIYVTTSAYNGIISRQTLILLGISSLTTISGAAIDSNRGVSDGCWPLHVRFFDDLLTDVNGFTLHRFQMLVWTVVLGGIYVVAVFRTRTMPQFDERLLTLLGISSGVYVGLKVPENQFSSTAQAGSQSEPSSH